MNHGFPWCLVKTGIFAAPGGVLSIVTSQHFWWFFSSFGSFFVCVCSDQSSALSVKGTLLGSLFCKTIASESLCLFVDCVCLRTGVLWAPAGITSLCRAWTIVGPARLTSLVSGAFVAWRLALSKTIRLCNLFSVVSTRGSVCFLLFKVKFSRAHKPFWTQTLKLYWLFELRSTRNNR